MMTKIKQGRLIYKCRNCNKVYKSDLIKEDLGEMFYNAIKHHKSSIRFGYHTCGSEVDGVGFSDLIGFTEDY